MKLKRIKNINIRKKIEISSNLSSEIQNEKKNNKIFDEFFLLNKYTYFYKNILIK